MKKLLVASLVLSVAGAYAASNELGQRSHSAKPVVTPVSVSQTGNQTAVATKAQEPNLLSTTRQLTADQQLYLELKETGSHIPAWLYEALFPQQNSNHALRQGGDTIAEAVEVTLPYTGTGTTTGYTDDYDEVCPYTDSTSPDVVYSFTPDAAYAMDVSLEGSSYDTKVYVYDSSMNLMGCNDDYFDDYTSAIFNMMVDAGETYYVVVDGYNGNAGDYAVSIINNDPCVDFDCTGIDNEDEGYYSDEDVTNGGCNLDTPIFSDLEPNGEYCGTMFTYETPDGGSRDMDWFEFTLLEDSNVSFAAHACGTYNLWVMNSDCENLTTIASATSLFGDGELDAGDMFAGTYIFVIAPAAYDGMPDEVVWHFEMTATPVTIEDPCENAAELVCGETLTGSNVGEMNYVGYDAGDVFYYFTLDNDGLVDINLCDASTDYDTYLRLFDGCPISGGVELFADDDGPECEDDIAPYEPSALESMQLDAGTYWVVVEGLSANEGNFGINLICADPCEDYDCTGIANEDEGYYTDEDVTNGGCNLETPVFGSIDCDGEMCGTMFTYTTPDGNSRDMDWFEFTLLEDATVTFDGQSCGLYNMWVLSDDCDNLTTIGSVTSQFDESTLTAGPLFAGTYIFIIAPAGYDGMPDETVWHVSMSCVPENIEDPCENATELTCGESYAGSNAGVMNYVNNASGDVFYYFTLAEAGLVSLDLCDAGTDYDTYLSVWDDCPVDGGTIVASNDDGPDCEASGAPYPPSFVEAELAAGTYFVVVEGYDVNEGNFVLHYECDDPCVPYDCTGLPQEGEGYYTDEDVTNGGCNLDVPIFSDIECNSEICGTFFTYTTPDGGSRDMDWYEITLMNDETMTFTGHACVSYNMWVIDNCDETNVLDFTTGYGTQTLELELTAGTYICLIAPSDYDGMPDETPYYMSVECSVGINDGIAPLAFELGQNYPNPFNPTTTISWTQPEAAKANLTIHNILGEVVASYDLGQRTPGQQSFVWNASALSSGVYLYTLSTAGHTDTYKAVLLK